MRSLARLILAVFALVCIGAPAAAVAQSFEIGVKGGVCLADLPRLEDTGSEGVLVESRYAGGVALGGSFAFGFGGRLAIQPEVLFVQKAHKERIRSIDPWDPLSLDVEFRSRLNYLELPVLVRFRAGGRGLHVLAGPSLNVSLDCWDCIEPLDVGLVIGAGVYGRLLTVEGRYEEGLMDTGQPWSGRDEGSVRNRAFLLLVGVRRGPQP